MAPAPHLVQALQDARAFATDRADDHAGWKAVEAQTQRVLERLDVEDVDPAYTDLGETEGPIGTGLDPDAADLAAASLTALMEQPHEEQVELALSALTDLEDSLKNAPGPGSHPGR
jgi:hypothetical protein